MSVDASLARSIQRLIDESDVKRVASEIDDAVDNKDWLRFRSY